MAAHVFTSAEPGQDLNASPMPGESSGNVSNAPLFASQPEVFQRIQAPRRGSAAPLVIGLLAGAAILGGLVYGMTRANLGANGATTSVHSTSQPPAQAGSAATPLPAPATGAPSAHRTPASTRPDHLIIQKAPPAPAHARAAPTHARRLEAASAAPAPDTASPQVAPAAPSALTPSAPQPVAPTPGVNSAISPPPPTPAPAPATVTPAPTPAPVTPAPQQSAPDDSAAQAPAAPQ